MQELNRNAIITAPKGGGYLELVDTETGELLAQFFVEEGRSKATRWLDLAGPGQELQAGEGLVILEPTHRLRIQDCGEEAFTSAANPDFRVTNAMRQARELDLRLSAIEVQQSRLRAREEVLDRVLASRAGTPPVDPEIAVLTPAGDPESSEVIETEA